MMTIFNLRFLLFNSLVIYCLIGCSRSRVGNEYPYLDELKNFILENHNIEQSRLADVVLLIIPVNSCSDCVDLSLEFAENHLDDQHLLVLLLADRNKDLLKATYGFSLDLSKLLVERKGRHNNYELGIHGPSVLRIYKGKVVFYETLHRSNFEATFKKLGY